ncbi:MAG: hypothetical protein F6K16_36485 [Symploca sp. SIO2B6]|nr:hypothetical protein [Symploca sp. SIO2B6]
MPVGRAECGCEFCGATDSYLDNILIDDQGDRMWICSDTDYCNQHQAAQRSPKLNSSGKEQVRS